LHKNLQLFADKMRKCERERETQAIINYLCANGMSS